MSALQKSAVMPRDLVIGIGATGLSVARYLKRSGRGAVFVDTRSDPPGGEALIELWPDAELYLGVEELPEGVDRVIVSPGIADSHALIQAARSAKLEVISDIELFAREARAPFIAVTGSNGKSTVTTLLHHMCRAAGQSALAGGNLGEPALDLLARGTPDVYVLELSSFQLQRTKRLPAAVAVLLNVSPDHLDWHRNAAEYRAAKYRIFADSEAAVFNRADPDAERHAAQTNRVISFGMDEPGDGHYGIRLEAGEAYLARGETLLLATKDLAIFGQHNQANALAALAVGELFGLDMPSMLQVLIEFPGLAHRMQFIARIAGVSYVNDSKATNVAAAVASIESIDGMLVLLAGGLGKGGEFGELATAVKHKLRAAVLFGTQAEAIRSALGNAGPTYLAEDMPDAIRQAASHARPGDTVLLAPACASFDQYANFAARGEAFRSAVEDLSR